MCPTDETILDAALDVLAREGYGGATTKKIAEEAGINEVTLFRKFKSKENLINEAKKLSLKRSIENIDRTFQSINEDDFEASVLTLGKHISDDVDKKTNTIMTRIIDMQKPDETSGPHFSKAMINHLKVYFEGQIEKGKMRDVDPGIAALGFFSFIFYVKFICKLKDEVPGRDADMALEEFIDIFMNGIKAHDKKLA